MMSGVKRELIMKKLLFLLAIITICFLPSSISAKEDSSTQNLIDQINKTTENFPDKPNPESKEEEWQAWRTQDEKIREERLGLIEKLEEKNLSDEELRPYIEMKIEGIYRCYLYAYGEVNKYEGKIYRMMDSNSPVKKMLSTELLWRLNILYVNTHLMTISENDLQQIADFELTRKNEPDAGYRLYKAVALGNANEEQISRWRTWILDNIPETSRGYQSVIARKSLEENFGKAFEFTGTDLEGNLIDSKKLKGKVILLDF